MGHFQPTSASAVCSGSWLFSAWPSFPWASLKLKQRQLPIQRLTPIFCMEATMDLDLDIMGATTATLTMATTERDLLRLSLFLLLMLMPRLKQTPGTHTMDTVLVIMVDTMVDTMATPTCMARGLLMLRLDLLPKLRLLPKLKLIRIFFMATMDLDIIMGATTATLTMAMAMVTTMASKKGRDLIES